MIYKGPLQGNIFILEYGIIKCPDLKSVAIFLIYCALFKLQAL